MNTLYRDDCTIIYCNTCTCIYICVYTAETTCDTKCSLCTMNNYVKNLN